ncbi:MAG: hypothetical protein GF375_03740, partial [Candidatus Omnitrophica bacterium]|nr:hypothetical protein [Candidatus Omnitrophota bacterium]MBD3269173.1 hypothetical protein [Candidatus Omnitrophota bacterium]
VMDFKIFAKLEAREFFKPAAVTVDKGIVDIPSLPAGFFYYCKARNQDIIIFLGEAQPPLEYAEEFSVQIINFVKKYKARFIFTFAAKPESIDHKTESKVMIAATHHNILKGFARLGVKTLGKGQISGLNGIVLGVGKKKGLKGVCLLAEIPFYTVQIENPRATVAVLRIIVKYLNINLNLSPVTERAKFIESEIDKLISYLKGEVSPQGPTPLNEEDIEKIKKDLATYTKLPQSARAKIEDLFGQAQKDITKANELKRELDHWNVYKEYEDKFLDLFKKKDKGDEGPH